MKGRCIGNDGHKGVPFQFYKDQTDSNAVAAFADTHCDHSLIFALLRFCRIPHHSRCAFVLPFAADRVSAVNVILYEVCFYIGVNWFLNSSIIHFDFYLAVFCIFLFCNLFLYLLHMAVAFRFGSSVSVLLGVSGTILAGIFENPMGDKIWTAIPWEWGVRFLKECMNVSGIPVFFEVVLPIIITLAILVLTTLWFDRWEGKVTQE